MKLIETIVYVKLLLRMLIAALLVMIIGYQVYNLLKPVPPLSVVFNPDYRCGTLPKLELPGPRYPNVSYGDASVEIVTKSDVTVYMPPIAYVYEVRYREETFQLRDRIFAIARTLGFDEDRYTNPKPSLLKWEDKSRTLLADLKTGSFLFSLKRKPLLVLSKGNISFKEDAVDIAKRVVNSLRLLQGYEGWDTLVSYWVYDLDGFKEVDALSDASMVKVDFLGKKPLLIFDIRYFDPRFRKKMDLRKADFVGFMTARDKLDSKYTRQFFVKTVGEAANIGNPQVFVHALKGKTYTDQVVKVEYYNWDIENIPCGTYPLISSTQAYDAIRNSTAYLAYIGRFGGNELEADSTLKIAKITINSIELAYYISKKWTGYLLPIYVVKGFGYDEQGSRYNLIFYVPALSKYGM